MNMHFSLNHNPRLKSRFARRSVHWVQHPPRRCLARKASSSDENNQKPPANCKVFEPAHTIAIPVQVSHRIHLLTAAAHPCWKTARMMQQLACLRRENHRSSHVKDVKNALHGAPRGSAESSNFGSLLPSKSQRPPTRPPSATPRPQQVPDAAGVCSTIRTIFCSLVWS